MTRLTGMFGAFILVIALSIPLAFAEDKTITLAVSGMT